jgi:hypothetical protein
MKEEDNEYKATSNVGLKNPSKRSHNFQRHHSQSFKLRGKDGNEEEEENPDKGCCQAF